MNNRCKSKNRNPCDFFIREMSINYPKQKEDEQKIAHYTDKYDRELLPQIIKEMSEVKFKELNVKNASSNVVPFCKQCTLLRQRVFKMAQREPQALVARLLQAIFSGLLTIGIYWDVGGKYNDVQVTNMAGCNFFVLASLMFNWKYAALLTFLMEKDVFMREQANQLYSPYAYFIAKNSIELIQGIIVPMI